MRIPTYTIFCKVCKIDQTFDLDLLNEFHDEITGLGHLFLNCHRCNDYSVYVGGKYSNPPAERYRYESYKTKKNLKMPIQFSFGWRYEKTLAKTQKQIVVVT